MKQDIEGQSKNKKISIWDYAALEKVIKDNKFPEMHLKTIYRELIRGCPSLEEITGLNKELRAILKKDFVLSSSKVIEAIEDESDETTKLAFELNDGVEIESVIISFAVQARPEAPTNDATNDESVVEANGQKFKVSSRDWLTLCVSSQAGCKYGCKFCSTGAMGMLRNLTAAEILEQMYHASVVMGKKIRNIVFMGMGEPFDNFEEVCKAVEGLIDTKRFQMGHRYITVSTVGVIEHMLEFINRFPLVNLALSLHAPEQKLRQQLLPVAGKHHIDDLLKTTDQVAAKTGRPVMISYVLLKGINDGIEQAHELVKLFKHRKYAFINLIPFNPPQETPDRPEIKFHFEQTSSCDFKTFNETLRKMGLATFVRSTHGRSIAAACGQLARSVKKPINKDSDEEKSNILTRVSSIADRISISNNWLWISAAITLGFIVISKTMSLKERVTEI